MKTELKLRITSFIIGLLGIVIIGFHSWILALGIFIYTWGLKIDILLSYKDEISKIDNHPTY